MDETSKYHLPQPSLATSKQPPSNVTGHLSDNPVVTIQLDGDEFGILLLLLQQTTVEQVREVAGHMRLDDELVEKERETLIEKLNKIWAWFARSHNEDKCVRCYGLPHNGRVAIQIKLNTTDRSHLALDVQTSQKRVKQEGQSIRSDILCLIRQLRENWRVEHPTANEQLLKLFLQGDELRISNDEAVKLHATALYPGVASSSAITKLNKQLSKFRLEIGRPHEYVLRRVSSLHRLDK